MAKNLLNCKFEIVFDVVVNGTEAKMIMVGLWSFDVIKFK